MNVSRLGRIFSVAVLVALLAACGPGTGSTSSKTLHVIGTWGGSEQASFMAMVKPWAVELGSAWAKGLGWDSEWAMGLARLW